MRTELSRAIPLVFIFVLGLGAGIWAFVSPWVLTYPVANGWSSSIWSSIWVGVIVAGLSGASAVVVLARALHLTVNRIQPASRNQRGE